MVTLQPWHNGLLQEFLLTVPADLEWEEALAQIEARLEEVKPSMSVRGVQITIEFGVRQVSYELLQDLVALLRDRYGVLVVAVVSTDMHTHEAARRLALGVYLMAPGAPLSTEASVDAAGNNALYYAGTVRSGQRLTHHTHLIVGGDVNPGAEVIAGGDIVVLGTLRGLAHAGCYGNEGARIIAGNMRPQQLRIAGQIARAPEEETRVATASPRPEVARIVDGIIQVSPL
ncbi:septum site-determining protein MinC [Chthonomonas calidirosea]|uniref:Probable septum site-determining protein MinC n=1 Tax=Chthonomonas calidirosea (strain DSM 23976 / ICMP 18418 / T49) TaxID=1303518 RepID=S0EV07_CHTCT|nr:septum site-determining protein MinC [Chthonomonas calidirosea]CCW35568.1 septum site-determining protein MinC [Chthonomonas calidirosea T49]CEK19884.1 septum site-determining protein MinC [Chthonomonas calidirosea]